MRAVDLLLLEQVQRADERRPRVLRFDDVVQEAAFRRDVGVGELFLVVVDQLLGLLRGILGGGDLAAISRLKMMLTAAWGPMTAISAAGQA